MVVGFLHRSFIEPNQRVLPEGDLSSRLDDYLYHLREIEGDGAYPKSARAYLSDWSADEKGWLRKFYTADSDEPHYDLMPAVEKAITWLAGLEQPRFVGAESRLLTVFELLQQIVRGSETDIQARMAELERRKAALEAELQALAEGEVMMMDDTRLRERFMQMAETARALLGDFRQVEDNFRRLDMQVRERITCFEGGKGEVLVDVFGEHDAITDSDQGRSFRAFWDFLMSPARQEEFSRMLDKVLSLDAVRELDPDPRLKRIHHDWLEAGEQAQRTVARLSEQLRRFLDDQAWLENRRIMEILRELEQHAVAVRDRPPGRLVALDEVGAAVELPMERPLFSPPLKPEIEDQVLLEGEGDIDSESLFNQIYVDRGRLRDNIRRMLDDHNQISLGELLQAVPLTLGLAELVTYLAIAADDHGAVIDENVSELVAWTGEDGRTRRARVPKVIFTH